MERVGTALKALQQGNGVLVTDDEARENEADLIFAAQSVTEKQMAMMIRECSGIVCLCLTEEKISSLDLPMMVNRNTSHYQAVFSAN
jgi:3,4-dihydroxy 2-butanone 4-phosphate synthase